MMSRVMSLGAAVLAGLAIATLVPAVPQTARSLLNLVPGLGAAASTSPGAPPAGRGEPDTHQDEGKIAMTAEQVEAAGIRVGAVRGGILVSRVAVPGLLAASQDRLARVTGRVVGTIAEVRRGLGDQVTRGDVLAVIESRDIAEARGEFLTASRAAAAAETMLARETRLWRQRISAEQEFLQARTATEEARVRADLARQRLMALGMSEAELAELPRQPAAEMRRLEIRAPITGRITARTAVLGSAVAAEADLFSIADLSRLWVEIAIPPRDLPMARQGQSVTIVGADDARAEGRIVFLSPLLDPETRAARAVAEIDNADGVWRPGGFVTANLATAEQAVDLLVPRDAVQEMEGMKVVFVRTPQGFERREVALGREDGESIEIIFGLDPDTEIAMANSFVLRAELGKSEAGHAH